MNLKEPDIRYVVFLLCMCLTSLSLTAQKFNDSILVNERKIDRPLTLHKGQLQFTPGYEISVISKEYDAESEIVNLSDQGTASVQHKYYLELNYGILDFLQASIALNYARRFERHETQQIFIYLNDIPDIEITTFDDYKGFEDICMGAVIRLPLKTRIFEFSLSPGFLMPLFSNNPGPPENSISLPSVEQPYTKITYRNNHKAGNGSKSIKIGASSIIRPLRDFSISARLNYAWPVSESETVRWIHQLDGSTFVYDDIPYKYLSGNMLDYEVNLSYQAISWFNVTLSWYSRRTWSGWSELTGFRIENPHSGLSLVSAGCEVKATGRLWLTEFIHIPVYGKSTLAPYAIYLGISYNLFPFTRNLRQLRNDNGRK